MMLAAFLLLTTPCPGGDAKKPEDPEKPKHTFACAGTKKEVDVKSLDKDLKEGETGITVLFGGQGRTIVREIAGGSLTFNVTPQVVWIHAVVQNEKDARPILQVMLEHFAAERGIELVGQGQMTGRVAIPVAADPGLEYGGSVPVKPSRECLKCVSRDTFVRTYEIPKKEKVELKIEDGKIFWVSKKAGEDVKEEAATFVPIPKRYVMVEEGEKKQGK